MSTPPFVLQFPGQGSQKVGMGKALCAASPEAEEALARADEVLGLPISRLCLSGPAEALNDTANTQPAILAVSIAALRALKERLEGRPVFVAGHSLGEFSALVAAEAISYDDALLLVRERGRLMKEAGERNPGGMAAVIGLDQATVEEACAQARRSTGGYVGIANDNCPGQVVISGDVETLEAGMEAARALGARRVIRLAVSIAAHSPLMAEAAALFRQALENIPLRRPTVPLVTNRTARPLDAPQEIREALTGQLTSPVRWAESVEWMIRQGVRRFIEVGPGEVLTNMLRRIDRTVEGITAARLIGQVEA